MDNLIKNLLFVVVLLGLAGCPAEPGKPAESSTPAEITKSAESAKPAETVMPTEPATLAETAKVAEASPPVAPGKPAEPSEPAAILGRDYTELNLPQPTGTNKIEVLEFFSYGCSHCFHLHHDLSAWSQKMPKDVELTYVPVIFRDSAEPLARAFYAIEGTPDFQKMHEAIYRGLHVENANLFDLASIAAFIAKSGSNGDRFTASYNSFSTGSKITRAKQMIRSYAIQGTPTLVVNGKYVISGLQPADTIRVLNSVISMARKERAKH
ncbi:MAG: DsbA family protein [Methylobacter sp.]|nr:DsbA family protein [Methylobacter sp.]